MKQRTSLFSRNSLWLAFAWLVVTAAAMCPQKAYSDVLWVDNPQSYSVNCFGVNTVKIKVPVYNKDGYDEWIDYGNIYYKVKGGSQDKVLMLYWAAGEEDISGSQKDLPVKFRTNAPGHLNVIRGSGGSSITSAEKTYRLSFNGSDKLYAEVEWTVPIELRGQTIIVSWDVQRDGNMRYEQKVDIDDKEVSIPAKTGLVDPILSEAIISDNPDYYGQLVVPWMITINNDSVVSSVMRYKDKNSQWQERTLETKATGYLNSKETVAAIQMLADLYKDQAVTGWNSGDIPMTDGFGTGRYMMLLEGPWKVSELAGAYPEFEYATAPVPAGDGGSISVLGGEDIGMFNTANKDAAWKFMKFMTGEYAQEEMAKCGQIPCNKEALESDTVKKADFAPYIEQLKTAKSRPTVASWSEIDSELTASVTAVMNGEKTAQEAMDDLAKKVDALLAE